MYEYTNNKIIYTNYYYNKKLVKIDISVLIVTNNRPQKVILCLKSLLNSTFKNYELIIHDQYKNLESISEIRSLFYQFNKVTYLQSSKLGKSAGLNQSISFACSNLLAFIDDDCIVNKNWLTKIYNIFRIKSDILCITGKTFGYKSESNKHLICRSTFINKYRRSHIINSPAYHAEYIGLGNNMAIRKKVINDLGGFSEWLGPGSFGRAAEDAEILLRIILNGGKIFYASEAIVYHNQWTSFKSIRWSYMFYYIGEFSCYGFYALLGHEFAKKILFEHRTIIYNDFKEIIRNITRFKTESFVLALWWSINILARCIGVIIACFYYYNFMIKKNKHQNYYLNKKFLN